MSLVDALALSMKVIADWRVLFMAVATLLVIAALRYTGTVYRSLSTPRSRRPPPQIAAKKAAPRERGGDRGRAEEESGEGMIE